jgi:hypothetical protein
MGIRERKCVLKFLHVTHQRWKLLAWSTRPSAWGCLARVLRTSHCHPVQIWHCGKFVRRLVARHPQGDRTSAWGQRSVSAQTWASARRSASALETVPLVGTPFLALKQNMQFFSLFLHIIYTHTHKLSNFYSGSCS